MPDASTLALFMAAGLALNLTPGPDMIFVATRSAAQGRTAGVWSSLGIAVGSLVHTALLALGVSAVLTAVPLAYDGIRYAGAGYLIVLGVRALAANAVVMAPSHVPPESDAALFRQGVITNVLNPKVALFFLAFLPQFVDPSRGSPAVQIVVLGLVFNLTGTLVNVGVAMLTSRATRWLRGNGRQVAALQRLTGVVFIGLGLRLALSERE
jgi:threonine/homoserine/homoserine lactone efflux protein